MPQSKGNATWMTNPRKIITEKNVRVDNSETYFKNDDLEQDLQVALDAIQIEHRRAMVEHDGDIKAVKESVQTMTAMQKFMKLNRAKNAFEATLKARKQIFNDNFQAAQNSKIEKSATLTKNINLQTSQSSGFSNVNLNDSDDDLDLARSHRVKFRNNRTKSAHPKLINSTPDKKLDKDEFTNNRTTGRPKSSFVSSSTHNASVTLQERPRSRSPSRPLRTRPKTTMSIRNSLAREFNTPGPTPRLRPKTAGRSFHELKGLTGFDAVKATENYAKRAEALAKRAREKEQDDTKLQERIRTFYVDLESFKRRTEESSYDP